MATSFSLCFGKLISEKMYVEAGSGEEGGNSDQAPGSPQKGTRGVPGRCLLPPVLPKYPCHPQALGKGVPSPSNVPGLGWGQGRQE